MERKTVREAYDEEKLIITGAPDSFESRRQRIYSIVIDRVPFGNHFVDEPRFAEWDMLARVLVSCNAENELHDIVTLEPRSGTHTPDFAAHRRSDGDEIRIEVTEFADPIVRSYLGNLHSVFTPLQDIWPQDVRLVSALLGIRTVFYFPEQTPKQAQRVQAREEMSSILQSVDRQHISWTRVYQPPNDCPLLRSLNVTFTFNDVAADEGEVKFKPSLTIADSTRIVEGTTRILTQKKARHELYSDHGTYPVWLAVFVADGISGVGLTAIQQLSEHSPEAAPFERLMIANAVAGLLIPSDVHQPAVYSSLTQFREIAQV